MSEEERYFAFIEHEGRIELVYWTRTEREAKEKVAEWKRKDKQYEQGHEDEHYYVGMILFPIQRKVNALSNQQSKRR